MKTYDVRGREVTAGIPVVMDPQPHVVLGDGGNKRRTWVSVGWIDANSIIHQAQLPCPEQGYSDFTTNPNTCSPEHVCDKCGERYGPWQSPVEPYHYRYHPKAGTVAGPMMIKDAGILQVEGNKFLIVAPRPGNRILLIWRVASGYRGYAEITPGYGVKVVASDKAWHSGRGNLGETAEMLAIMEPGQELRATIDGENVEETRARLLYDGTNIIVKYGDDTLFVDESQGEYL